MEINVWGDASALESLEKLKGLGIKDPNELVLLTSEAQGFHSNLVFVYTGGLMGPREGRHPEVVEYDSKFSVAASFNFITNELYRNFFAPWKEVERTVLPFYGISPSREVLRLEKRVRDTSDGSLALAHRILKGVSKIDERFKGVYAKKRGSLDYLANDSGGISYLADEVHIGEKDITRVLAERLKLRETASS